MHKDNAETYDLVIVGGGVSGLALAYYLEQSVHTQNLKIAVLEASDKLGGKLRTSFEQGFVMDEGPDSIATRRPEVSELLEKLDLQAEMITPTERKFTIFKKGKLLPVQLSLLAGFPWNAIALLQSPLISWPAKIRAGVGAALGYLFDDRLFCSVKDQSLADYFRKKYGIQAYQQLFSALFSGLYGGDLETISYKTFKSSAVKSAVNKLPPYVSFRNGMCSLIFGLEKKLQKTKLYTSAAVSKIGKHNKSWRIVSEAGSFIAAKVVLAIPAIQAGKLVEDCCPKLAAEISGLLSKDAAIMTLAYKNTKLQNSLAGSGVIVPDGQSDYIRGITISSEKWSNRADHNNLLLRVFAKEGIFEKLNHNQQKELAVSEVKRILDIRQEPVFCRLHLWPKGSVHFGLGHFERMSELNKTADELGNIKLLGSSFGGIGIGDCIWAAKNCANKLTDEFSQYCSKDFLDNSELSVESEDNLSFEHNAASEKYASGS